MHADLLTCLYANLCHLHSLRFVVLVRRTLTSFPLPVSKKKLKNTFNDSRYVIL